MSGSIVAIAVAVTSLEGRAAVRRTDAAKPVPLATRLLAAS